MMASSYLRSKCVRLLIVAGANLDLQDNNSQPVLLYAYNNGDIHAVKLLIVAGAAIIDDKHESFPGSLAQINKETETKLNAELEQTRMKLVKVQNRKYIKACK